MTDSKTGRDSAAEEITGYLAQCNGFEQHYKHWLGRATYSAGVRFVAEAAGAYWLVDAIMSHQSPRLVAACQGLQFWTLSRNKTGSGAKLVCTDGGIGGSEPRVLVRQRIEFTDFPLSRIEFYVEGGVLMLAQER